MEALGGEEYSSYSFATTALDGGEWSVVGSNPAEGMDVCLLCLYIV
jgi:hypothetical protein